MVFPRLRPTTGAAPVTRFGCRARIAWTVMAIFIPFWSASGRAGEIGFVEEFALAEDREAVLARLVPGTEESFYFQALHRLNTERYAEIEPILAEWVKAHGETARVWEIRSRRALLTYAQDPQGSIGHIIQRRETRKNGYLHGDFQHVHRNPTNCCSIGWYQLGLQNIPRRCYHKHDGIGGNQPNYWRSEYYVITQPKGIIYTVVFFLLSK